MTSLQHRTRLRRRMLTHPPPHPPPVRCVHSSRYSVGATIGRPFLLCDSGRPMVAPIGLPPFCANRQGSWRPASTLYGAPIPAIPLKRSTKAAKTAVRQPASRRQTARAADAAARGGMWCSAPPTAPPRAQAPPRSRATGQNPCAGENTPRQKSGNPFPLT